MKRFVQIMIIGLVMLATNAWGATYYVDPTNGTDQASCYGSPGEGASACATINYVFTNVNLAPADIVEVQAATEGGSVTCTETVSILSDDDGDSNDYLIIRGRAGDTVTINGGDYAFAAGGSYIQIDNFTITSTTSHGIRMTRGDHYYFKDITMTADIGGSGFYFTTLDVGTVIFEDCTASNTAGNGIWFDTGTDDQTVTATNLTLYGNTSHGIRIPGGLVALTLTDCDVTYSGQYGLYADDVDGAVAITGGDFSNNTQDETAGQAGIFIEANNTAYDSITIDGVTSNYNYYHGFKIGFCDPGSCGGVSIKNTTASYNYCSGVLLEDGDNGANAVLFEDDTFIGNNVGCFDVPSRAAGAWIEDAPNTTVRNCLFKNTEVVGENSGRGLIISTDGTEMDADIYGNIFVDNYIHLDIQATGGIDITSTNVLNNTFKDAEYGSVRIHNAAAETIDIVMKNNISDSPGVKHVQQLDTSGTEDYDYNDYYPEGNDMWTWGATTDIDTLAAWQSATSQDANSLTTDPKLNSNYGPREPLVANGGTLLSWLDNSSGLTRYGSGPPIGAKEKPEFQFKPRTGPPFSPIIGWSYYTP